MEVLNVRGLYERYLSSKLEDISFTIQSGAIMGFVDRNGAGKSTTLKSMLNFIHPDTGDVEFFGLDSRNRGLEVKGHISFTFGEVNFYPKKRIQDVTDMFRRFFRPWDKIAYHCLLECFELAKTKKLDELSQGMHIKYAVALPLSHEAELILLDEPTSGLDPVSRDGLLDMFHDVVAENGASILFSTQIMTDLEKCTDTITYIHKGRTLVSTTLGEFTGTYQNVDDGSAQTGNDVRGLLVGCRERDDWLEALIRAENAPIAEANGLQAGAADLKSIMTRLKRK